MRKLNDFLKSKHPSGLVDVNYLSFSSIDKSLIVDEKVRVFVDGDNGVDANDGSSWALAKKTILAALDIVPTDINCSVYIIVDGANLGNLLVSQLYPNAKISIVKATSYVTDSFFTNEENHSFTDVKTQIENIRLRCFSLDIYSLDVDNTGAYGLIELVGTVANNTYVIAQNGSNLLVLSGVIITQLASTKVIHATNIFYLWNGEANCNNQPFIAMPEDGHAVYFGNSLGGSANFPNPNSKALKLTDATHTFMYWIGAVVSLHVDVSAIEFVNCSLSIYGRGATIFKSIGLMPSITSTEPLFALDNTNLYAIKMPTSDPLIADALWNDLGTVKISAG